MEINSAFILAGGKGTRLKELTHSIPKPMMQIINKPMLIHIINHYKNSNVTDIYILTGFKQKVIFDYFEKNYVKIATNSFKYSENCTVHIIFTGIDSLTANRIKKGLTHLKEDNFYLTYGDALSDINLQKLKSQFANSGLLGVVTAVRPPARFGSLELDQNQVISFEEKVQADSGWINGGYFVLNKEILKYITDENESFEGKPLEKLAKNKQLLAYKHTGFWQCVDTIREKEILENAIQNKDLILYE